MKIAEIVQYLESIAHPSLQEDYDNAGLITGSMDWECSGAIVCLDATEAVINEAVNRSANLVIAHHPVIFKGLKQISGSSYIEKTLIAAIKCDIAIYAIHTNLDNVQQGVNGMIARQLGLQRCRVLAPKAGLLKKLYVFVPADYAPAVRTELFRAGAGCIGKYSECSFNSAGTGTFTAAENARPFVGEVGRQQQENEIRIETIFPAWLEGKLITALKTVHPYEEVAYDIVPLHNTHPGVGAGIVGELEVQVGEEAFLKKLQEVFLVPVIRHTPLRAKEVKTVAVCGGAGSFLVSNAIAAGADFYITADVKYHEFFNADACLVLADVGHYESEQFTIDLLTGFLREKFPTFAALKTEVKTNPVLYFQ